MLDQLFFNLDGLMLQQRFNFRRKSKYAVRLKVIQWLLPDAVAKQKQLVFQLIDNSQGKHSFQFLHHVDSPGGKGLHDDFGIGMSSKCPARLSGQLLLNLLKVVNLSIKDNDVSTVV